MNDFSKFLISVAGPVVAVDRDYRIVFWNDELVRLLGYSAGETVGRRCSEVLAGTDETLNPYCSLRCPVLQRWEAGETVPPFKMRVRTAAGQRRSVTCSVTVIGSESRKGLLLYQLHPEPAVTSAQPKGDFPQLSAREQEVLRLLAVGKGLPQIAESLGITGSTVRNHVQNILRRLGVHSRLDAVLFAQKNGLLPLRLESGE